MCYNHSNHKDVRDCVRGMYLVILMMSSSVWGDSFINKLEYGQMLYANPRGIGCGHCHGDRGEGRILGTTMKKNSVIVIKAPPIAKMDTLHLATALAQKKSFMPTYHLTTEEIDSIRYYLTTLNAPAPQQVIRHDTNASH